MTRAPTSTSNLPPAPTLHHTTTMPTTTSVSTSSINSENDQEEFIPNLANLPSLKLGTPANDGHLPVGGSRRPQELHDVGGSWKNSTSINGEIYEEDDETSPDNDALNRCCHITCYIL